MAENELKGTDKDNAKTEEEGLREDRERLTFIKDHSFEKNWRESADTNFDYFTGSDQGWDEEGDRSSLEKEKRPALTLNRIHPIIRLIVGARPQVETSFFPVGAGGDLQLAAILNSCKEHIEDWNMWKFLEADFLARGTVLDRAVVALRRDYEQDPRGDVMLELVDGKNIYPDPDSVRKDRKDGIDLFEIRPVHKEWAIRKWPKMKERINNLASTSDHQASTKSTVDRSPIDGYLDDPASNYYDSETKKISLTYRWYKTFEKSTKLIDTASGQTYDSPLGMNEAQQALQQIQVDNRIRVVERDFTRIKYKIFAYNMLFEEGVTPWERSDGQRTDLSDNIPFVIFEPDRWVVGSNQELVSFIKLLHDPQKNHNKLASSILSIINSTAKSGYDYEDGALSEEQEKRLNEQGSKPGVNIKWNKGAISGAQVQKRRQDVIPQAEIMLMKQMASDLLDISGVEALVSTQSLGKSASGTAIGMKMQQGGNIIDWIYSSFSFSRHQLTAYERDAIQCTYDYEKVITIHRPRFEMVTINQQQYDWQGLATQLLNDVTAGRYGIRIKEKPDFPSLRIERFKYFSEMVKSGALALPPEVINKIVLELMDDPDLKEVVEQELGVFQQQQAQVQQQMMAAQAGGVPGGGGGPTVQGVA